MDSNRYEVIEAKVWRHVSGRTASTRGAHPWTNPADAADWKIETQGWTVRNPHTGETGMGHRALATRELAEALALRLGRPSRIGLGD
jgi:hypothetical protein